jgi:hypothetical protein
LIFPGGAEEVLRKKHEGHYELRWNNRRGFAKLAIQHGRHSPYICFTFVDLMTNEIGYNIIPFAAVGVEDSMKILFDLPIGALLRLIGDKRHNQTLPIISPFHLKPQKTYFVFGQPIDCKRFKGNITCDFIIPCCICSLITL